MVAEPQICVCPTADPSLAVSVSTHCPDLYLRAPHRTHPPPSQAEPPAGRHYQQGKGTGSGSPSWHLLGSAWSGRTDQPHWRRDTESSRGRRRRRLGTTPAVDHPPASSRLKLPAIPGGTRQLQVAPAVGSRGGGRIRPHTVCTAVASPSSWYLILLSSSSSCWCRSVLWLTSER